MPDEDRRRLVPSVIETLRRLGEVDPPAGGYGHWDESGTGTSGDWWEFLLSINAPESEGFYAGWTDLFASGALDRQVWERLYRRLQIAAERLGETPRGVVHFDFGGDNLMSALCERGGGAVPVGASSFGIAGVRVRRSRVS